MPSPHPIPAEVKRARGVPEHKCTEAPTIGELPAAPPGLPKAAVELYRQVCEQMDIWDMASATDAETVTEYCVAWSQIQDIRKKISKQGRVVTIGEGSEAKRVSNPLISQEIDAWNRWYKLMRELGRSPSARVSIKPATGGKVGRKASHNLESKPNGQVAVRSGAEPDIIPSNMPIDFASLRKKA
jgi:P27 family predicted phage terminase small subunit